MTSDAKSEAIEERLRLDAASLSSLVAMLRLQIEPTSSIAAVEISRRFSPLIHGFWIRHRCGEFNDFHQEVLARLFSALPKLQVDEAFPGLFKQIVLATAGDYWRKEKNHLNESDISEDEIQAVPDPRKDFTEELATKLFVRSFLDRLPVRERLVLRLLFLHELDIQEVAKKLEITPGAVRMTKARAFERLRHMMGNL